MIVLDLWDCPKCGQLSLEHKGETEPELVIDWDIDEEYYITAKVWRCTNCSLSYTTTQNR